MSEEIAIACSAGGFKGVFVHGVLSAFESSGLHASAYAAASSSIFPAISSAIGQANEIGLRYWRSALHTLAQPGNGMSEVVLRSIEESGHLLQALFQPGAPRFLIAVTAITTAEAAAQTQGDDARRPGRRLLVASGRHDRSWIDRNARLEIFDTGAEDKLSDRPYGFGEIGRGQAPDEIGRGQASPLPSVHRLTAANINEVIYASTRMLHAWRIPAWIAGRPYMDALYTCFCPAIELARRGYCSVIAIVTEPGIVYRDMFQDEPIPLSWGETTIHFVQPDRDLAAMGTDFTSVTEEGLVAVYEHGKERGREFLGELTSLSLPA